MNEFTRLHSKQTLDPTRERLEVLLYDASVGQCLFCHISHGSVSVFEIELSGISDGSIDIEFRIATLIIDCVVVHMSTPYPSVFSGGPEANGQGIFRDETKRNKCFVMRKPMSSYCVIDAVTHYKKHAVALTRSATSEVLWQS